MFQLALFYFLGALTCLVIIRVLNYIPIIRVFESMNYRILYTIELLSKEIEPFNFRNIDIPAWRENLLKRILDKYPPNLRKVLNFSDWKGARKWMLWFEETQGKHL